MTSSTIPRTGPAMLHEQPLDSSGVSARPKPRGYTIIEVLMVLILVGLMAALSAGRVNQIITKQRVNRAAYALASGFQQAFVLAQRDRKPMRISFDSTMMQFSTADRAGNKFGGTPLAGFNIKPSNVTVSRSMVEVYPIGLAQDSLSVTLSVTAGTNTYTHTVRMTRGGMVQVK